MSSLSGRIAKALGWRGPDSETLRLASVPHDVGKIGVPDAILLKSGPLDPEERRLMETHPSAGHAILAGARSDLLQVADTVAWTHHERMDGSGYPRGLRGAEIPVAGRIAAVADVFDALTSDRPYRGAFSEHEALELIWRGRGTKFDARAVDALLAFGV
jgi:putative two-component system response regulator